MEFVKNFEVKLCMGIMMSSAFIFQIYKDKNIPSGKVLQWMLKRKKEMSLMIEKEFFKCELLWVQYKPCQLWESSCCFIALISHQWFNVWERYLASRRGSGSELLFLYLPTFWIVFQQSHSKVHLISNSYKE